MCSFLFSVIIVGAMEATPGWMTVEYVWKPAEAGDPIETMTMPTEQYLECYAGAEDPTTVE